MRRMLAGAACLALLVLIVSPLASDARKKSKPRLAVATFDGPEIDIPPSTTNEVGSYVVRCPRGWQATGFGVINGVNDVVYADPTRDGRGYEFLFGNPDNTVPYSASGSVRCEKGGKGLKVRAAVAHGSHRAAASQWLAANR
jgi:hypothetical protein